MISARVANGVGHQDDAFGNYSSYGRTPGEAKGRKGEVGRKWDDQDDKLLQVRGNPMHCSALLRCSDVASPMPMQ